MERDEVAMHQRAGRAYGRSNTCRDGEKQDYKSEETATAIAVKMTAKFGKEMEAYPCVWCEGWHIGRAMTAEEREHFSRPQKRSWRQWLRRRPHRHVGQSWDGYWEMCRCGASSGDLRDPVTGLRLVFFADWPETERTVQR